MRRGEGGEFVSLRWWDLREEMDHDGDDGRLIRDREVSLFVLCYVSVLCCDFEFSLRLANLIIVMSVAHNITAS